MLIFLIIVIVIVLSLAGSTSTDSGGSKGTNVKNNSIYTDEELDAYGLLDYEKEEVKKGNYDPWQFDRAYNIRLISLNDNIDSYLNPY